MDITGQPSTAPVQGTTETAPAAEAAKEDIHSSKFAALAKKEKWLRKMQEDVKKQQEEFKKKELDYQTSYVPKSRVKEDFLTVAMEAGLTADQIANMLLSQSPGGQTDPNAQMIRELREEIKQLKGEFTQTKTGLETKEKTQYEQAVNQVRADVTRLVDTNADFETIKATGMTEKVVEYIKTTYEEDGVVLSAEQAAKEVQDALIEDALAKFTSSKTLQEKLSQLQSKEAPKQQTTQQPQARTLTNAMKASSKPSFTKAERRQRAILRGQGFDPDAVNG